MKDHSKPRIPGLELDDIGRMLTEFKGKDLIIVLSEKVMGAANFAMFGMEPSEKRDIVKDTNIAVINETITDEEEAELNDLVNQYRLARGKLSGVSGGSIKAARIQKNHAQSFQKVLIKMIELHQKVREAFAMKTGLGQLYGKI